MKRDYEKGVQEAVTFFTGIEVEKTPAFGMKTLFVTGLQDPKEITKFYKKEKCEHIFFGANHSFNPQDDNVWAEWEYIILHFLKQDILCSLDIPLRYAEDFLEIGLTEHHNFIPQLRIPLPYVEQWNYNTMLKIDDKDFKATNPGIWTHSLHDLKSKETFTDWTKYRLDKVLK
mgnify:CR=1 FL=1|tara:strand:+ start:818 stop:1336 length:519 start_codon:yes stop_codon:yes gene_type:complete